MTSQKFKFVKLWDSEKKTPLAKISLLMLIGGELYELLCPGDSKQIPLMLLQVPEIYPNSILYLNCCSWEVKDQGYFQTMVPKPAKSYPMWIGHPSRCIYGMRPESDHQPLFRGHLTLTRPQSPLTTSPSGAQGVMRRKKEWKRDDWEILCQKVVL